MKERRSLQGRLRYYLFLMVFCATVFFQHTAHAAMSDYCITPPFIVGGIYPNLLLMLDNSASMYDLAYIAGSTGTAPTYSCTGGGTATTSYCMDNTYDDTYPYAGYFDKDGVYSYNGSEFVIGAAIPSPCTYSTNYMCVNVNISGQVDKFVARGNFLNWLSASKFDIEKKILTGGKYDTINGVLLGETRGCVGRRFIKEIPAGDFTSPDTDITFAIRGPNPLDPDFAVTNFSTEVMGGSTKIEIYQTAFNNQECQCAVYNWTSGNYGQASTDTKGCLDVSGKGNTTEGRELSTFNHSLQVCWQIKRNIQDAINAGIPIDSIKDDDIFPTSLNYQDLLVACSSAYDDDYGDDPTKITDRSSGNYICTAYDAASNPDATHLSPVKPYDVDGSDTTGFLGKCWKNNSNVWPPNTATTSTSTAVKCIHEELLHYCMGQAYGEVIDPSQGTSDTSSTGNIPAVIMDAGVRALGDPLSPAGSTDTFFNAKVALSTAPMGLIQQYASTARIGAMSFNYNGSATECGRAGSDISCPMRCSVTTTQVCSTNMDCPPGERCNAIQNLDSAQIISYIGDPLGDHTVGSGLISSIDALSASSWTPFAEAFYDAIGYFARTNDYTSMPGTSRGVDTVSGGVTVKKLRINNTDYDNNRNPSQYKCQANNVVIITDGMSTADQNPTSEALAQLYNYDGAYGYDTANSCPSYAGSRDLDELAWLAKNRNIKNFSTTFPASTAAPEEASEYVRTYVVYSGPESSGLTGKCDPRTLMCDTSVAGGGTPTGGGCGVSGGGSTQFFTPKNPDDLGDAIGNVFKQISAKTASGTAASVLASGEGSGANLIQAIFFPTRKLGTADITWSGLLQNLWYYIDPNLESNTIREDTVRDSLLNLKQDNIVSFVFDPLDNSTKVETFADSNGDGMADNPSTPTSIKAFEKLDSLWEAGSLLLAENPGNRTIYTNLDDNSTLDPFNTSGPALTALKPMVNVNVNVADDPAHTETAKLVNYVSGVDDLNGDGTLDDNDTIDAVPTRKRTVTVNLCSASHKTCSTSTDCGASGGTCSPVTDTWKLGDIVDSTPKILSWLPLNDYDSAYEDTSYTDFTTSDNYKSRGMVFTGANDGMLHAFRLGTLEVFNDPYKKAEIKRTCSFTTSTDCTKDADCLAGETCPEIGQEMWGFIPKNSLPYLKYMADKNYCHLYYVDQSPVIVDASINKISTCTAANYWDCDKKTTYQSGTKKLDMANTSWRTILIGSMREGGACRNVGSTCTECVKTPVNNLGYSTYFALDVTDPYHPKLLWEFADSGLGYSTTGPAIIRVAAKPGDTNGDGKLDYRDDSDDPNVDTRLKKNGRWFAVFGAGPTGYISPGTHQFLGITEHITNGDLRLFVVDLATGQLARPAWDLGEYAAFAGSLLGSTVDFDNDYQDDAFYVGYSERSGFTESSSATGSGQAGTFNTITLASGANATDDYYKGMFIHNALTHETKLIIGYNGNSKIATVDSNWQSTPPSAGTPYDIFPGWNTGGVMRIYTKDDLDPNHWTYSKLISGTGAVTASIAKFRGDDSRGSDANAVKIYFGSGRFFYRVSDIIDDANTQQAIYGVTEPCYKPANNMDPASKNQIDFSCTTTVSASSLGNADSVVGTWTTTQPHGDPDGWYINLDGCTAADDSVVSCSAPTAVYKAERVTTSPLAASNGIVFFTTSKPSADVCSYGGKTHLWAVRYDTGGAAVVLDSQGNVVTDASGNPQSILRGKALIQKSTTAIEQIDFAKAFTERNNKRTGNPTNTPGGDQGLSNDPPQLTVPPVPVNRILHIRKK